MEWFELRFGVDDPGGAISVHASAESGACWPSRFLRAFPFLPRVNFPAGSAHDSTQWLAQIVAIATLLGFVLPLTYGLNLALDRILAAACGHRRRAAGPGFSTARRRRLSQFVTHSEEFTQLR